MPRCFFLLIVSVVLASCGSLASSPSTARPTITLPTQAPFPTQPPAAAAPTGGDQAASFPKIRQPLPTIPADDSRALGEPTAPVTIIEYSDFECPFCLRHVFQVYPDIKAKYIDTGRVRYVFRNYVAARAHLAAPGAAVASLCAAEQGQFWPMHDTLFLEKSTWEGDPARAKGLFAGYAKAADLDMTTFAECQNDPTVLPQVEAESQEAQSFGATGTPTFYVGQYMIVGAESFAVFEQAIALAEADAK